MLRLAITLMVMCVTLLSQQQSKTGLACALARSVLREDGGTHYVHVCQHGWDHHRNIWDRTKPVR